MNVKITAVLTSPLVLSPEGYGPELDAIVEYAVSQKQRSISDASCGRHGVKMRGEDVDRPGSLWSPFMREKCCDLVIPRVSSCIIPEHAERHDHIAKRFPFEALSLLSEKERQTKVNITGGEYKGWYLPLRTTTVERVCWFAVLRDKAALRKSPMCVLRQWLNHVHAVGKKTAHGYGRVSQWCVESVECDASWFAPSPHGQVLMRRLPVDLIDDKVIGWRPWFGGCCPPYWQKSLHREIAIPC